MVFSSRLSNAGQHMCKNKVEQPKEGIYVRGKKFIFGLLFESARDWLKAGVIALSAFVLGNFLGWFIPSERPIYLPVNHIGQYIDGYTFLTAIYDRFRDDTDGDAALVFDPPDLNMLRICRDLNYPTPPEGFELIKRVAAELPSCIKAQKSWPEGVPTVTVSVSDDPMELVEVEREGKREFLCGCNQQVIEQFLEDTRNP